MDPTATTMAAAAAQGHITQTRRPHSLHVLSSHSSPAFEKTSVDPALSACSLVESDSTASAAQSVTPAPSPAVSPALTPTHSHRCTVHGVLDAQPDQETAVLDDGILTVAPPSEDHSASSSSLPSPPCLEGLPSEMLLVVVGFLDVNDIFHLSRTSHRLRSLCLDPIVQLYRLRNARLSLSPLLSSPSRPTLADLIARSIFLTNNTVISRRLARSLVSIRLSRRLAQRPSAESLVQRSVLPCQCVPGMSPVLVAPALVAKRKAIEKERLKDSLRSWIASKWKGEVKEREEGVRKYDEANGIGRVWKLRRFWEKVGRGEIATH